MNPDQLFAAHYSGKLTRDDSSRHVEQVAISPTMGGHSTETFSRERHRINP